MKTPVDLLSGHLVLIRTGIFGRVRIFDLEDPRPIPLKVTMPRAMDSQVRQGLILGRVEPVSNPIGGLTYLLVVPTEADREKARKFLA